MEKEFNGTPHIHAKVGDFAKTVLMPGDPKRAKFIAEKYLKDAELVSSVRNMYAYTGTYNGKRITIMGSGMGIPSIGIYSYELFAFYGVERIIRIGSCGSYQPEAKVYDVIMAQASCTNSNYASQYNLNGTFAPIASYNLLEKAVAVAKQKGIRYHVGNVLASDIFYSATPDDWKAWADMGVLGVEMESFALYCNAAKLHKEALTLLTVSDSFITHEETTSEERQKKLMQMVEIALELA